MIHKLKKEKFMLFLVNSKQLMKKKFIVNCRKTDVLTLTEEYPPRNKNETLDPVPLMSIELKRIAINVIINDANKP